MMFRRCCQCQRQRCTQPPMQPQGDRSTCQTGQMVGQGDGRTAQMAGRPAGPVFMMAPPQGQQPCRCRCKEHASLQPARAQLIESIAQEEQGLADILAAEAQKLTRAAQSASMNELMAVNQSVRQTIEAVIDLEHILLEKLELTMGECMLCQ